MSKTIRPTNDRILVKPIDEGEQTYGSIVIPDMGKEKALIGTIVSVGPGQSSYSGAFIPTVLEVGMEVMLPSMGPNKIELEGQEYWVCPENQVLAIIQTTEQ